MNARPSISYRLYTSFTKRSDAEFIQYRSPVGFGPSSNTCPRCASHSVHETAVRSMPRLPSEISRTFSFAIGSQKLGQPVPESNFVAELNSALLQQMQRKIPFRAHSEVCRYMAIPYPHRRVISNTPGRQAASATPASDFTTRAIFTVPSRLTRVVELHNRNFHRLRIRCLRCHMRPAAAKTAPPRQSPRPIPPGTPAALN